MSDTSKKELLIVPLRWLQSSIKTLHSKHVVLRVISNFHNSKIVKVTYLFIIHSNFMLVLTTAIYL